MKQITQKEFIELIREKQKNAQFDMERHSQTTRDIMEYVQCAQLTGNIKAYEDLICYLNSVEIVPDRIEANKGQFVGGEEQIPPYIKAIVGENYENCFAPNLKVSDKGCVEEQIVTTIPKAKAKEM